MDQIIVAGGIVYGLIAGFTFHWLMQPVDLIETRASWWRWLAFAVAASVLWPLFFFALACFAAWVRFTMKD